MDTTTNLIIVISLLMPFAHAQNRRFESDSYTTQAACAAGSVCPGLAIPGTTVKICIGAGAPCAKPATTYLGDRGAARCPPSAPVVPVSGAATQCLATTDSHGNFAAWLPPGTFSYYLTLPASAGGKTFGPYPFIVKESQPSFKSDADYTTLASACTAAGSGTLTISRAWKNLMTETYGCRMVFLGGGILQPASAQTVTITGFVTAPLVKIFDLSAGGKVLPAGSPELYPQWYGAKGDGTTDDSAAIQEAELAAAATGKALHFTASTYGICAPSISVKSPIVNYGDGSRISLLQRHSSCLQAATDMFTIITSDTVDLHDLGADMLGNGKTFAKSAISIRGAHGVKLSNLYVAHGQVTGLECDDCSDVSDTGSVYYQNWWFGKSIACNSGGTANPVFNHNFTDTGVHYEDEAIGLGYNFFCSGITVSGDTFDKSTLAFIQMPNAQATVKDIRIDGVTDYGCLSTHQCGTSATYDALFMEGVSGITIDGGSVSNFTGQQGGVFCGGSQLAIPTKGPVMQLPCSHVTIRGVNVDNTTGFPIYIHGQSYDGSAEGVQNSIQSTRVTNSTQCQTIVASDFASMEGNDCEDSSNSGYSLGRVRHSSFINNRGHNIGMVRPGRSTGLLINDALTQDVDVENNVFVNDNGHTILRCFDDETLATGHPSQVKYLNNTCEGASAARYPVPPAGK